VISAPASSVLRRASWIRRGRRGEEKKKEWDPIDAGLAIVFL